MNIFSNYFTLNGLVHLIQYDNLKDIEYLQNYL